MKTFFFPIFLISSALYGQIADIIRQGDPYRLYPSNTHQTEPFAAVDPADPNHIFVSGNTTQLTPFFISEGIYVSTDGGSTWRGTDTCSGAAVNSHGGDPGITIDAQGRYVLVRLGRAPFYGLFSHTSSDKGLTWSAAEQITNHDLERANVAADVYPGSPYYGRIYATYVRFAPPYAVYITYSDNAGATWAAPVPVNNPSRRNAGVDIAVKKNGEVYLSWAGVANSSPFQELTLGFGKSSNGGSTWTVKDSIYAMNGITGTMPSKQNIRVNGYPRISVDNSSGTNSGSIYIVTTQKNIAPAGSDPDLILHCSRDNGTTWLPARRVNGDALNNGKTQYFPALDVDAAGGVNIMYYDDRLTTNDSTNVFLARSTDGGMSFSEMELTNGAFKPEPVGGLGQGYQGDNIALQYTFGKLLPVWMDNRNGRYQLYSVPLQVVNTSIEENSDVASGFELMQNYPNPFNPSTTISFNIDRASYVELSVYDVLGREVAVLISENMEAGRHSKEFNAAGLNSGIYYYRLRAGNLAATGIMNLIK